ncbi:lipase family protein [Variovorax sp. S2]|uniref:lipase family protein n=1 Tax=Variovorax sp. S12S4 TaxID=3029170 RepID=UPI00215C9A5F|nr:lipase family protein [Variovorax sp. S12S4]MCR8959840.1 lipase family protein [Variovorax sp. S12S4]
MILGLLAFMTAAGAALAQGRLPIGPAAGDMALSPFYRVADLLPEAPGVLLREEPMPDQPEIDAAGESRRILYTSTDVRWQSGRIPVSGALHLPAGEVPAAGWPVVAWAHGTLGIADVCAPSWTGLRPRDARYINRWLKAGFAVVVTDYQGLGGPGPHPYLNWQAEGRSVLDSVRAAIAARPRQISNRVLLAGQSQGSGAAVGAARLAREYAPELNVLGAVATGLVSTFPAGPVSQPVRNSSNMFLAFAAGGLRDDGPRIDDIVSNKGHQLLEAARSGCTGDVMRLARRLRVADLGEALSISPERLAELRLPLTDMPMGNIGVPLFVGTGLADATITPVRQHAAVAALCAAGNNVTWSRYEGHGHDGALHGSFDDSLAFARAVLAKKKISSNCGEIAPPGAPGKRREDLPFNDD